MRALVGFLIAPLPVALYQALMVALLHKGHLGITRHPSSMFVATALYFYSLGLVVGMPILFLTRKRENHTLRGYASATALIMLVPIAIAMFAWTKKGHPSIYAITYFLALFGLGRALAGSIFWWIAKRKRQPGATSEIFG